MPTRGADIFSQIRPVLDAITQPSLAELCDRILAARRIFLLGAGQTGLVLQMLAMRMTQAGLDARIPGDCTTPAITGADLLLTASASGSRPGILALARSAAEAGAPIVLITATPNSPLAELAGFSLFLQEPERKAEPYLPLGTWFELSLSFLAVMLVQDLLQRLHQADTDLRARHANLE